MAAVGLRPGADRRRAVAGRLRRRRVPRLPARPAVARGGLALALRAAVRADRRAAARRRCSPRRWRCSASTCATGSASGSSWSTASAARCSWRAWASASSGSAARWRSRRPGARELREPIQRSAILQRAQRGAAALRADPPGAGALRPVPAIRGPVRERARRRTPRSRATPQVRAAGRSVVSVLGTACGLGVQGSGWVAARRARGDQRARGGRPGRHHRPARAARARRSTREASGSTPATTWRSCACRGSRARRRCR